MANPIEAERDELLAAELAGEWLAQCEARRSAERHRGVCWSGLGPDPHQARTAEAIAAEAEKKLARRVAWRGSPVGHFVTAIAECQVAAHAAHDAAERAREACSRNPRTEAATCSAAVAEIETQAQALLVAARAARRAALRLAAPWQARDGC